MSNLEASRILASALKDVDEILKVSGCESNDICDAYDNLNNQYTLPEKSVQNVRRESYSKNIDNSTACDETYLYKTEKEFFTLMNRLHKCIEKLHSSQNIALLHTSEYCASNFKVTGNSHINVVEPSITQPTEYNLINNKQSVQLQQRQPHYMASSNDYENLNDKLLHQRIIRLQAQIQAQANRIAELEKDKTSLSHLVNRANRTGQNDIMNQFTIDMDNLQLLSEVSKQHLRITSLEEMNRDLEEKINKLEKELSHRSDLFDVRNSYKDSQSLKYNRQYANQHPMMSSRSATLGNNNNNTNHTLNDESSKQMILQNRLHYPAAFRRSITPVAFNNRNSFIATSNPYEYNSNFIYQSSLSGTQSTPPTSRLINDQLYTNNTFLQNERIHPQRLLIPGENYFLLNADQFRSASLNELRYSKSIQSNTVTNKVCNPNVKNGFIVKSPADSFNVNTSIDCSRIFNSRNLLPPQYGSSYHQKIYTDSSRARSPPPQHLQTYHQKNNSIDDRQSLADCKLNECASSLSPSTATLGSPSSGKFTTGQTTQSKASPSSSSSSSEYQHFTEITNQLGNLMKDNKAPTLSKSTTINNNGKNHFKKLNIEHDFHWLSHGQMDNNILSSNGLVKSNSIHHKSQKSGSMNASLYSKSKSLERSYNNCDSLKCSSTVNSRRKTHETLLPCINNVYNANNNNDILSEPICNSSSSSTTLLTNSIYDNKSQQINQECLLKSNRNELFNKKISIQNNTVLNNKNNPVRAPNSSGNYENRSSVSLIHHTLKSTTTPHLDNVNKSSLSHNGLNSSIEQRQTFQFAYTKRNFLSWDKNMISAWLYKIGLGYTVTHTRKWLTSGQDLVNESKKSLAQLMGIRNPLHLKKLLIHIRLCMKDNCPASNNTTIDINNHDGYFYRNVEPPENFDMSGWLNDLGLSQYIPQFDKCIIDPYVLDQLTMEDLSMLKISNELHMLSLRWGLQMLRHINFDRSRLCRDQMEQCSANIPLKRNILHSSIPSENENHSHTSLMNTTLKTDSMNIKTNSNSSIYSPIQICYWTQKRVVNWLQSIELPEYASELCGNGVHGALIILEDRFTPDLLADILRIPPVKSLVRRHLTQKFIELVGLKIWQRKQHSEVSNNLLTLHSKIKLTKKKSIFHSTRGSKSNLHHHDDDNDISNELVCPNEINTNHISIFAEEVVTPNQECIHETGNIPTILLNPIATNVQKLELQETDL